MYAEPLNGPAVGHGFPHVQDEKTEGFSEPPCFSEPKLNYVRQAKGGATPKKIHAQAASAAAQTLFYF